MPPTSVTAIDKHALQQKQTDKLPPSSSMIKDMTDWLTEMKWS